MMKNTSQTLWADHQKLWRLLIDKDFPVRCGPNFTIIYHWFIREPASLMLVLLLLVHFVWYWLYLNSEPSNCRLNPGTRNLALNPSLPVGSRDPTPWAITWYLQPSPLAGIWDWDWTRAWAQGVQYGMQVFRDLS